MEGRLKGVLTDDLETCRATGGGRAAMHHVFPKYREEALRQIRIHGPPFGWDGGRDIMRNGAVPERSCRDIRKIVSLNMATVDVHASWFITAPGGGAKRRREGG